MALVFQIFFGFKPLIHTYPTFIAYLILEIEYLSQEKFHKERETERILEKIYSGLVTIVLCQSQ